MVRWRAHIVFISVMIIYFILRILRSRFPELPDFIRFQLTDLLFVPAMCLFALIFLRLLKRDNSLSISWSSVAIQVVLVSVYFERYLPNNEPEGHVHVSDWLDCLMYVIGGITFILIQPHLSAKNKNVDKTI